jgi:ferric-dicitrate binding protein FerR (iron transport regulator)
LKILRQSLAFSLTLALSLPGWGGTGVVGVAVQSQSATVHQAALVNGSTVYSGDSITAGANGRAQVSLPGGGRVDVLSNSTVLVERNADGVELTISRGNASFQTRPDSQVAALFPDARVRAPKGESAMGIIGMESPTSALVVAKIGTLEVFSEHDSRTVLVPEGSAARITLLPEEPSQGPLPTGVQPAGRKSRRLATILLIAGGGVTAGAILAATGGGGSSSGTPMSPSVP